MNLHQPDCERLPDELPKCEVCGELAQTWSRDRYVWCHMGESMWSSKPCGDGHFYCFEHSQPGRKIDISCMYPPKQETA